MRNAGKAREAGRRLILFSFVLMVAILAAAFLAAVFGSIIVAASGIIVALWIIFVVFSLNFFRDPDPRVPTDPRAIVSPAHGKVDVIDETTENEFLGGPCKRVSVFLSVFDVHVQSSPIRGTVAFLKHCPGKFLNAMNAECGLHNENVLIGLDSVERPGERISIRLIAGLLARRIIPWVNVGDALEKGDRTSLIQFGSRVDLYLPLDAQIQVKLGDRVKGGESIIALRAS